MDRQIAFILKKNQNSQGDLITLNSGKKEQDSRGGLKNGQDARFVSNRPIFAELNKQEIQAFQIIPDYDSSTVSPYPVIVKSPTSCHCIDGWDKVESSIAQNQSTLTCHVFYIPEFSETEIAIRKVAIRTMPQGGTCSYAELVRNAGILFNMLLASSENPVVFSHGGARRGVNFTENKEENIRELLAERLGKSQTTINKYLQHGDSLNDTALESLVDSGAPKHFFEAFQTQKQVEVAALNAKQIDETAIVEAISKQVLEWLSEYLKPVPPKDQSPVSIQEPETNQSPNAAQSTPNEDRRQKTMQKVFQASYGRDSSPTIDPAPANPENAETELKRIGEALIEIADDRQRSIPQKIETVKNLILELTTLVPRLIHMGVQEDGGRGGDV